VNFNDLKIIQKFLYNRVDFDLFKKLWYNTFGTSFIDDYLMEKFRQFRDCPINFILAQNEELFNEVLKEIKKRNYKG